MNYTRLSNCHKFPELFFRECASQCPNRMTRTVCPQSQQPNKLGPEGGTEGFQANAQFHSTHRQRRTFVCRRGTGHEGDTETALAPRGVDAGQLLRPTSCKAGTRHPSGQRSPDTGCVSLSGLGAGGEAKTSISALQVEVPTYGMPEQSCRNNPDRRGERQSRDGGSGVGFSDQ